MIGKREHGLSKLLTLCVLLTGNFLPGRFSSFFFFTFFFLITFGFFFFHVVSDCDACCGNSEKERYRPTFCTKICFSPQKYWKRRLRTTNQSECTKIGPVHVSLELEIPVVRKKKKIACLRKKKKTKIIEQSVNPVKVLHHSSIIGRFERQYRIIIVKCRCYYFFVRRLVSTLSIRKRRQTVGRRTVRFLLLSTSFRTFDRLRKRRRGRETKKVSRPFIFFICLIFFGIVSRLPWMIFDRFHRP